MLQEPNDRQQRIDAVAAQIQEVTAGLTDPEEQREAEVKALVASVPSKATYSEQLKAFTGITHVMRVMMAGQLEPKFREYLKSESPKRPVLTDTDPNRKEQQFREASATFAKDVSNGLFRVGLGMKWEEAGPCYLGILQEKQQGRQNSIRRQSRIRFRVSHCGESEGRGSLVTNWSEEQVKKVGIQDAAPPNGENALSPIRR